VTTAARAAAQGGNIMTILVMRHAEKPDDSSDPDLSRAGHARAIRLATFIPEEFGKPDFIIAAAVSHSSARPYETVRPLSKVTDIGVDATIADADYPTLAKGLLNKDKFFGKLVVVCWHHGNIPKLMESLGAKKGDYPDPWDPAVFNLILQVTFTDGKASVKEVNEPF
jgi:broad specificity phosphatase PhoE